MRTEQDVINWAKALVGDKHGNLDSRFEDIARYVRPQALGYQSERTEGSNLEEDVYDSLPIDQADRMARNLYVWILNPATRWYTIEWQEDELKENAEAKEWLEDSVEEHQAALNESNWSLKALEAIHDLVGPGTAMKQVDEMPSLYDKDDGEFRGLLFKTHHMSVSYGQESVDTVVRNTAVVLKLTALEAAELYGEDELPAVVKKDLKESKPTKHEFVHAIVRRRLPKPPEQEVMLAPEKRPYWTLHFHKETGQVVKSDGYYELTRCMPRYSKTNDSDYGYSPSMKALPSIRLINEAQRRELEAWARAIDPPVWVNVTKLEGDKVNNHAKGVTLVNDDGAVGEMPGASDLQAHMIVLEDHRQQIRDIYLSDELDIPDRERVGQMTAYEIQKRIERILRSAGSVVTAIHDEMLTPMLMASFMLMLRRNAFKPLPQSVAAARSTGMKVTLLGPLARAQRGEDADAIRLAVQDVVTLSQAMPTPEEQLSVLDNVDLDASIREMFDAQGVPQEIRRNEREIKERRDQRRELAAQLGAGGATDGQGPGVPGPATGQ